MTGLAERWRLDRFDAVGWTLWALLAAQLAAGALLLSGYHSELVAHGALP